MAHQQFADTVTLSDGRLEVKGILPRDTDENGKEIPYDPLVAISWFILQGDEIVQGSLLAGGSWSDTADAGKLTPGPALAAAVSVILRRTPESETPGFETFTWSQEVEIR